MLAGAMNPFFRGIFLIKVPRGGHFVRFPCPGHLPEPTSVPKGGSPSNRDGEPIYPEGTSSTLRAHFGHTSSTLRAHFEHTSSTLRAHFGHTSGISDIWSQIAASFGIYLLVCLLLLLGYFFLQYPALGGGGGGGRGGRRGT